MKTLEILNNQKGIATAESALLLTIFVVFMTYSIGFFGVVHTGILNSISARGYAFETFRNRTNLTYFRNNTEDEGAQHYSRIGYRVHGVVSDKVNPSAPSATWYATDRNIAQGRTSPQVQQRPNPSQMDQLPKRESMGVNPVWIKTTYGICITSQCGDNT